MPSSLGPIRRLGPADLKACLALSADRQWPAEERKWALLLEAAEGFGIDDPDGGLAGAVVLARYGSGLASVGMMLVASRYRRRGLGHRLMTHLGGQAGRATVFLTATSYGRPLYEKLGFRTTGRSATFVGAFRPAGAEEPDRTWAASAADLGAIAEVDRPAFGADREYLLRRPARLLRPDPRPGPGRQHHRLCGRVAQRRRHRHRPGDRPGRRRGPDAHHQRRPAYR